MTVALAVRKLAPTLLAEARAACSALGLVVEDWVGGIPRNVPQIVITSIDSGDRYLPEEICALLEASPGVRAVICATSARTT